VHADDDALVFLRESPDEVALVHCARGAHDPVALSTRNLPGIGSGSAAYGPPPELGVETLTLRADGPQVSIWTWTVTE
jgi:alpha-glucosidase